MLIRFVANPHVRFLVSLMPEDRNAGGCKCLLDFFRNGFAEGFSDTGRRCWKFAQISKLCVKLRAYVLEKLRQSVGGKKAFQLLMP